LAYQMYASDDKGYLPAAPRPGCSDGGI
jgi:hypothetical protein